MCVCGKLMCFKCGEQMHEGRCKNSNGLLFALWASTNNFAICPSCRARAIKDDGCNHMTCPQCKHVYCWICKKDLRWDHYKHFKLTERPFGCGFALHSDNFFVILLTLAIRHYMVPLVWWLKYIKKPIARAHSEFESIIK
jgi:IBR domain, a half RING-finger domain